MSILFNFSTTQTKYLSEHGFKKNVFIWQQIFFGNILVKNRFISAHVDN